MDDLVFLAEIAGLSGLLCVLHALRHRLGLAPLYVTIGLLEVFLFVAGKGGADRPAATILGGQVADVSSQMFMPLLLASMVLVYLLEGTREARRLVVALVAVYLVHGIVDQILYFHGTHPPPGRTDLTGAALIDHDPLARLASLLALLADLVTAVVVTQFLRNRLPKVPIGVPVYAGLVAAMVTDAIVFKAVNGLLVLPDAPVVLAKLQSGAAAGIPVAIYLSWALSRAGVRRDDLLDRGSLAFVDLRREVAEVRERLQEQQAAYRAVKETFSRYVSPQVAEQILADPEALDLGGDTRDVTVLFADIRGYSTLSETLSPHAVIDLLNTYLQRVGSCVLDAGGMINEIEGDGILAVFGAPLPTDDHADRALEAAVDMLAAVERLNAEWAEDGTLEAWRAAGLDRLAIRIGIHSGEAVVGNVGTAQRTKYAVIGDTVNTAARIEGLNKQTGTSLLLSGATVDRLQRLPDLDDRGEHQLAGKRAPVPVYTVRDA